MAAAASSTDTRGTSASVCGSPFGEVVEDGAVTVVGTIVGATVGSAVGVAGAQAVIRIAKAASTVNVFFLTTANLILLVSLS